jgi:hypothetical protein
LRDKTNINDKLKGELNPAPGTPVQIAPMITQGDAEGTGVSQSADTSGRRQ